jgi:hypothetical protein
MPPPDPNMTDENQGPAILGATLTVTIVALITTSTRMYVRIRMIRNVGWDVRSRLPRYPLTMLTFSKDYIMLSAMLLVRQPHLVDMSKANNW